MISNAPRILVADDERVVRDSFRRVLTEEGYTVETVNDGVAALKVAGEKPFDIVFLDLKMPGVDGLEVARTLRKAHPAQQIVIVTGYGSANSALDAARLGICDFVSKPVQPSTIQTLAKTALSRRQSLLAYTPPNVLWEERAPLVVAPPTPPLAAPSALQTVDSAPLAPTAVSPAAEETSEGHLTFGEVGRLLSAPFLGLLYLLLFPVIGALLLVYALGESIAVHLSGTD